MTDSTNKQSSQKQSIYKQTEFVRLILKKTDIRLNNRRASRTHDKVKQMVNKERAGLAEAFNTVVTRIRLIVTSPFRSPRQPNFGSEAQEGGVRRDVSGEQWERRGRQFRE